MLAQLNIQACNAIYPMEHLYKKLSEVTLEGFLRIGSKSVSAIERCPLYGVSTI